MADRQTTPDSIAARLSVNQDIVLTMFPDRVEGRTTRLAGRGCASVAGALARMGLIEPADRGWWCLTPLGQRVRLARLAVGG